MTLHNKDYIILTDLDGVIRVWTNQLVKKFEQENSLDIGSVYKVIFSPDVLNKAITGLITCEEWYNQSAKIFQDKYPDVDALEMIKAVRNEEYIINLEVLEVYKKYFKNAKLALGTNSTSNLSNHLKKDQLEQYFEYIYNSYDLGVCKPFEEYYLKVINNLDIKVNQLIYIDDSKTNVSSARKLGIISHHYQGIEKLEAFLSDLKKENTYE